MKKGKFIYRNISSMEPVIPTKMRGVLAELSSEIFRKSGELKATLPSGIVRMELAALVREMNSYYSNLIEGHKTLPREIQKALSQEFSQGSAERRNQLMSVAHIRTDEAMRKRLLEAPDTPIFGQEFICWLHQTFYEALPKEEWYSETLSGDRLPITPGAIRNHNVDVGKHTPPDHAALPKFIDRFQNVYQKGQVFTTDSLIAAAAAHHRLAWIHPFSDGNGRVARLHSHAALIQAQVDSSGLWTLSRGFARSRSTYYSKLQNADLQRTGDLDGRGNLSDQKLAEFCQYFLEQVLDQITFMADLLRPKELVKRIEKYLHFGRDDLTSKQTEHFCKLLKTLCWEGEMTRGKAPSLLGLKGSAGREVLSKAQSLGLITSSTPKGPVRITFPSEVIEFYFPRLFADLPVD